MLTRRNALKLAAALPVAAPSLSRSDALAALDAPAATGLIAEPTANRYDRAEVAADPSLFAQELVRGLWTDDLTSEACGAMAEYRRARKALEALYPEFSPAPCSHPHHRIDEAVMRLASDSYLEGVRVGAAAERFRQAVIGPKETCRTCWGVGIVRDAACPVCKGEGLVLR